MSRDPFLCSWLQISQKLNDRDEKGLQSFWIRINLPLSSDFVLIFKALKEGALPIFHSKINFFLNFNAKLAKVLNTS